jgi:hypothetical protein
MQTPRSGSAFWGLGREREIGEIDVTKHRLVTGVMISLGKSKQVEHHAACRVAIVHFFFLAGRTNSLSHVAAMRGVLAYRYASEVLFRHFVERHLQ